MSEIKTIDVAAMTFSVLCSSNIALHSTPPTASPNRPPLVILLHGFPQTFHTWREQVPALEQAGFAAVAPNQRGYSPGARPEAIEHYRTAYLVSDVLALADCLGYEHFHLVGHDWGGQVSWLVAAQAPERLHSLTVLSRPHPAAFAQALAHDPDQAHRSRHHHLFHDPTMADKLLEDDARRMRRSQIEQGVNAEDVTQYLSPFVDASALNAALNWYRAGSGQPASDAQPSMLADPSVPLIRVPTLYIWGDEDSSVGRYAAEQTAQFVDAPYRFEALTGIGHFVTDQAAQAVTQLLLEQLTHA